MVALVVSDAPDREDSSDLRRMAEAELPGVPGRIVSIPSGEDTELAALMAGADALCLPSRQSRRRWLGSSPTPR